ncbi:MAG: hypothetical protein WCI73_17365, partial [Phycisphaerae bacterium]
MMLRFLKLVGILVGFEAALLATQAQSGALSVGGGGSSVLAAEVGRSNSTNPARSSTDQQVQAAIAKGVDYLWIK